MSDGVERVVEDLSFEDRIGSSSDKETLPFSLILDPSTSRPLPRKTRSFDRPCSETLAALHRPSSHHRTPQRQLHLERVPVVLFFPIHQLQVSWTVRQPAFPRHGLHSCHLQQSNPDTPSVHLHAILRVHPVPLVTTQYEVLVRDD